MFQTAHADYKHFWEVSHVPASVQALLLGKPEVGGYGVMPPSLPSPVTSLHTVVTAPCEGTS